MKSLKHLNKYLFKYKYRLLLGFVFIVLANFFKIFPAQLIREALNLIKDKLSGEEILTQSLLSGYIENMPISRSRRVVLSMVFFE